MAPRRRVPTGADVVSDARRYFGVPYVYGGTNRRTGLDCSGLVLVVCQDLGITSCPRTSEEQWAWVDRIDSHEISPGDLVFFVGAEIDPPPGHVGILVSPGMMIDAPYTGTVVQEQHFSDGPGTARIIGYGRIPGVNRSPTSNANTTATGKESQQPSEIGGAISGLVSWVVILTMFAIIIGALVLIFVFMLH